MSAPTPKRLGGLTRRKYMDQRRRDDERVETLEAKRAARKKRTAGKRSLPADVEAALQARAAGRCELCGQALQNRCQRHHRKLRAQGGRDTVTNLVLIHPACHHTVHMNPEWAREHGWIVTSRRNPATVPVTLHTRRQVLLTPDGEYREAA
ncbi:MAG: HNH endonuclease [Frankiales bacterium]|nr:HNH endonuclease [Frankiales bacterium]